MKRTLLTLVFLTLSFQVLASIEENFDQGTQEFGVSNIGIGFSSAGGIAIGAQTRYQYYLLNRFSLGGTGFYHHFGDDEWFGAGPVASYILFMKEQWFSRLDQQVVGAKFNGFTRNYASFQGSSGISVGYVPLGANYSLGAGYIKSYALSEGATWQPDLFQLNLGFFF